MSYDNNFMVHPDSMHAHMSEMVASSDVKELENNHTLGQRL